MEEVFKILFAIGIIVIGFIDHAKKDAKKKSQKKPAIPPFGGENPLPDDWIPEVQEIPTEETRPPQTASIPRTASHERQATPRPQPFLQHEMPVTPSIRPTAGTPPSPSPGIQPTEQPPAVDIHSVEEVRKAVIWSAILKRVDN